jgi:hypothetical protein
MKNKSTRQAEAVKRQEAFDKLSTEQKLAQAIGKKERAKFTVRLANEKKAPVEKIKKEKK